MKYKMCPYVFFKFKLGRKNLYSSALLFAQATIHLLLDFNQFIQHSENNLKTG